ncbi:hypothetical protein GCM10020221_02600 [Streptomyces thioluteus]|uniref:Aspartate racemase n=1 Tax=Streptomyces thioluteus TaxID=66431 RepID=A0ABN3WBP4_STRTU
MKTIGLLGGMSWESTAEYYRLLNRLTRERLGGLHSARCVLYSVDFAEIERLQVAGRWQEAGEILADAAKALEAAGAELLLLCTNTPCTRSRTRWPPRPPSPCCTSRTRPAAAVRAAGARKVALLGTAFTDGAGLLQGPPRAAGRA